MPFETNDYLQKHLSLDEFLIKNHPATFLMRISGQDMSTEGVFEGDYILVDRSVGPRNGDLAVVIKDGELVLAKWSARTGKNNEGLELFGTTSTIIRKLRNA